MPVPEGTEPQTLGDAGIDSLTGFVEDYVTAGLGDLNYAVTDLPGFLADEAPVTTAALFPRTVLRGACRSYARGSGPQNLPGFDAAWGGICEPYLESIGENPTPGSIARPYTGGQCPANYTVEVRGNINVIDCNTGNTFDAGPAFNGRAGIRGPISGLRLALTGGGACGPTSSQVVGIDGNGTPFSFPGLNGVNQSSRVSYTGVTFTLIREDGQPDSCGDPPPLYDPPKVRPGLPPLPPTTPVDIPGIGPVDIGVEFSPSGEIVVSLPEVGVEVNLPNPFDGQDDSEGGDGGPADGPPGDVGEPGSPELTGEGGEAEGEAPEGSVLTGLRVELLSFPGSRTKYTEEVYRGAYYVYMGVPGLLDLDFGGAMVRLDQFFFAEKDNLTRWRVSANTGYSTRVTPYYRSTS